MGPGEVRRWETRAALLSARRSTAARHAGAWLGVLAVYAAGAGLFAQTAAGAGVAIVAMATLLVGSLLGGWLVLMRVQEVDRPLVRVLWLRMLWWLHGPWLLVGPSALFILAVAFVESTTGSTGEGTATVVLVGTPMWLIACFLCVASWTGVWSDTLERLGIRLAGWTSVLLGVVVITALLAACVLGLAGGVLATAGAMTATGLD